MAREAPSTLPLIIVMKTIDIFNACRQSRHPPFLNPVERNIVMVFWLFLFLYITKPGRCAEESENLKKDIRLTASVARSFSNAGHILTKVELSYGVWFEPWFRLGIYVDPYWQDFNDGTTHAIEWGLDARFLFLREESWCMGLGVSGGLLHSNDDFPQDETLAFNFGSGIELVFDRAIGEKYNLEVGYKISHYSNGGVGYLNPGIDYHALMLGVSYNF